MTATTHNQADWPTVGHRIKITKPDGTVLVENGLVTNSLSYMGQFVPFVIKDLATGHVCREWLFHTDRQSIPVKNYWGAYQDWQEVHITLLEQPPAQ